MAIAYVLITAEAGKEHQVYTQLLKVPEVREVMPLFGEYDLICKLDALDLDTVRRTSLARIRTIPGVTHTKTLTATKL